MPQGSFHKRPASLRDLQRWERLLEGEVRILAKLVGDSDLHETLEGICRLIETFNPEILSSVLLQDPDGVHIRPGAGPSLPAEYMRAMDGLIVGPGTGSCGTAMHRREPVIVGDIETDPLWGPYKALALPHGLRACWSTPILSGEGRVEGSFAMYFRTPRLPSADELKLVDFAAGLTGVAIDRIRAHMRLHETVAELEAARSAAEEASRRKGEFLTGLSHELRSPLDAILLLSELMAEGLRDPQMARDLQSLRGAGQQLLSLVDGMLDLARIEVGAMALRRERVSVPELLGDLSAAMKAQAEARGNRLETARDPGLASLRTDFAKLRQVLFTLLAQANAATEKGTLLLEARRQDREAHFRVRDAAGADGAKLGLTLARQLCGLLGGRLEAEGSTFIAVLPLG